MTLKVGTQAPNFTTKDDAGNNVSLGDFSGKVVILYFYPKDDTPGCTKQAISFRDSYDKYKGKDVVVLGVSQDDEASHKQFKEKYDLPFTLLTDVDGTISRAYHVDGDGYAKRVTYVIDKQGVITNVESKVNTDTHAEDLLASMS